jgi:hypothetical protein
VWLYIIKRSGIPSVLVTFDNKMPTVHRASILKRGSTLAVVDSKADRQGLTREQYTHEVIHRWAHRMARQTAGSRFRYSLSGRMVIPV